MRTQGSDLRALIFLRGSAESLFFILTFKFNFKRLNTSLVEVALMTEIALTAAIAIIYAIS